MSEIILTDANFEEEVLKSQVPVLVDFWATWCGPCKMIAPVIEEIAKEFEGKIKVGKLNVDENQNRPAEYGISAIPTILIFKEGNIAKKIVGFSGKPKLVSEINSIL
ncbi:MAG: thioredoxin [Elusimicrobia bacterium RIFOXYC2_FULL_34_12]|nr:MAG: thioredoxin [Elusimicrobia bacterium RIFOXYC2_FULL_34_12]OGS38891.1 MAG: thioredoxin [Elusimicrobia bacterium RIFOXYD2_FULL_34_30]HAM39005.1 thioredoxin [Elusimicrobiota bacterium]